MSKITEIKPLNNGQGPNGTLETNAYGGCYIDRRDFEAREQIEPDLWRMYDHEDEAIPEAGPLYQYADGAMVAEMQRFFDAVPIREG